MIDEKVFKHVQAYLENEKWEWPPSEKDIIETIKDAKRVWKGNEEQHRWWNIYDYVVEIDGMFIGYEDAESTGDMTAYEAGYEFYPESICEYEPRTKTITTYEPK